MELRKTEKITKQVNAKVIIGILIFSGLIATFNETILNVALSPLMIEMNVTAGTIQIIGILSLILFCKRQLSSKEPMLDIRVFKYKKFTIATVLVMLSMMTIFTMAVMLPMFLQGALETNTFTAAMALLPATLISGALTPVAGKIYDKKGSRILLPTGFIIILVSLFILAHSSNDTSLIQIILVFILVDIGVALTMSPSQTVALSSLPKDYYPHGVAILNTLQQLASAIGSSLFIGIMSAVQLKSISNGFNEWSAVASGFNISTLVLSGFVLVAVILSMILPVIKNKKSTVSDYKSDDVINL